MHLFQIILRMWSCISFRDGKSKVGEGRREVGLDCSEIFKWGIL